MTSPSRTLPPAVAAARIAPLLLALAGLAIAIGAQWLWRHRRQIAAALVAAVATTYLAGAWCRQQIEALVAAVATTYAAGTWCRLQIKALAADAARRLPAQPVAALAPITTTLAAAWGLADRVTTAQAKRSQWARLRPRPTRQPNKPAFINGPAATAGRWSNDA